MDNKTHNRVNLITIKNLSIMKTTNNLKHNLIKTINGLTYYIAIRLNDECKNGHNDFSITGMVYEADKPKIDRYCHGGGAMGDTLAKLFPELSIFNELHLCDVNGAPMYAIENGFYFIQNEPKHIMSHFRVNEKEAEILKTAEDRQQLIYMIEQMGLIKRWKDEANKAIKLLEEWTGEKFKDDSKKLQVITLKAKDKALIDSKIKAGYYTEEECAKRVYHEKQDKLKEAFNKIEEEYNESCDKHFNEYLVKKAVLLGGLSLDNLIYYNHTNEAVFNWKDYDKKITKIELEGFMDWLKLNPQVELPKDVIFKLKTK